jgi:hypothetical protein
MVVAAKPQSHRRLMIADLLDQLGGIAPDRVRLYPSPGKSLFDEVDQQLGAQPSVAE